MTASKASGYTLSNTSLASGDGMSLGLSDIIAANLTDSGAATFHAEWLDGGGRSAVRVRRSLIVCRPA